MKIGIIGAMQMEVDNLKEAMENQTTECVSGVNFVSGNIGDVEVVAAVCGVHQRMTQSIMQNGVSFIQKRKLQLRLNHWQKQEISLNADLYMRYIHI